MRIVGIAGRAGSGKDTLADYLVREHGFVKVALADPLKRICRDVFDFTDTQLWGPSEERNRPDVRYSRQELVDPYHPELGTWQTFLTPRYALQRLGTEWGRDCFDAIWMTYMLRMADRILNPGGDWPKGTTFSPPARAIYSARRGLEGYTGAGDAPAGVVVPDVRFRNEVEAIMSAGGYCCQVVRPGAGLAGTAGQHVSERDLDGVTLPQFVNDGAIEDLGRYAAIIAGIVRERTA